MSCFPQSFNMEAVWTTLCSANILIPPWSMGKAAASGFTDVHMLKLQGASIAVSFVAAHKEELNS